ncbi:hypothetical protein Bbelb_093780 [Branchiostoma belcheri]|nr:hypothetical protein Bbelb_093780 [Branchiostoma belcheri]
MASFTLHGDEDFATGCARIFVRYGSLSVTIVRLQQLTGGGRGFRDVLSSYKAMPEWSSEEARNFRHMMGLIRDACTSFGKLEEAARSYVLRIKAFARENMEFVEDVRDGLAPEDVDDLLKDWIKSIDDIKECNGKIEIVKDEFDKVLDQLETAKGHASSGRSSGRRKAEEAQTDSVVHAVGGTAGTVVGTAATVATAASGGLLAFAAIPIAAATGAFGGWTLGSAIKSAADSGKYREWEEAFALVARQLEKAQAFIGNLTAENKKTLTDLAVYSRCLQDKSLGMADKEKIERFKNGGRIAKQFERLEEESKTVKTACIEYIKKDNEARGITGTMAQLSLK